MAGKGVGSMAREGEIIDGKYQIIKKIGEGGMSSVYLAVDKRINKRWAIKEIRKEGDDARSKIVISSASSEVNILKKLNNRHLPGIIDIIESKTCLYVIMDYIDGENLGDILRREGRIKQSRVIKWAREICSVLIYLHGQSKPIIYRDMKPENIMVEPDDEIKLIDFGIAREYKNQNTQDTICLGTKGYAAPEQFGGSGQSDARTDIYCFGVTLYHLLTGKNPAEPPYRLYPIRYWDASLSPGLEAIINKCTQADPNARYQTAIELQTALSEFEKEDIQYKLKRKRQLRIFQGVAVLAVISFLTGALSRNLSISAEEKIYNQYLYNSETASDYNTRIEYAVKAIELNGSEIAGYERLISIFKEDGYFTTKEESILIGLYENNITELKRQTEYAYLSSEIGKLYWYYYSYGNDNTGVTAMKASVVWFQEAVALGDETDEFYNSSRIYYLMGCFHRDITTSSMEGTDVGLYARYYELLCEMLDFTKDEKNVFVILQSCEIALFSIENYAGRFAGDGISEAELNALFVRIDEMLSSISINGEKNVFIYETICSHIENCKNQINYAYTR